jgi:hypothetical protein
MDGGVRTLVTAGAASLAAAAGAEGAAEAARVAAAAATPEAAAAAAVLAEASKLLRVSQPIFVVIAAACEAKQEGVRYFGCCGRSIGKVQASYNSESSTLSMEPLPPMAYVSGSSERCYF